MSNNAIIAKTSRIVGLAAVLGTTAALVLAGSPADAATVGHLGRGVVITLGRGV